MSAAGILLWNRVVVVDMFIDFICEQGLSGNRLCGYGCTHAPPCGMGPLADIADIGIGWFLRHMRVVT